MMRCNTRRNLAVFSKVDEMMKTLGIFLLLHATISAAHRTNSLPRSALFDVIEGVGGVDQISGEVDYAIANASWWRNGMPASKAVGYNAGSGGTVLKICFEDGVCWADKMFKQRGEAAYYGTQALLLIEKYCPNIPAPKVKGWCERKLEHYFTEWIEGKALHEWVFEKDPHGHSTNIKIPRKMVTSLAEFVYNLTTCPIPQAESKNMFDKGADIL
jgi:hypothetical protein